MPLGLFLAIAAPASAPRLFLQWLNVMSADSLRQVLRQQINEQRQQAVAFSPLTPTTATTCGDSIGDAIRRLEILRTPLSSVPYPGGSGGPIYAWVISRYNVSRITTVIEQLSGQGLLTLIAQSPPINIPLVRDCLNLSLVS